MSKEATRSQHTNSFEAVLGSRRGLPPGTQRSPEVVFVPQHLVSQMKDCTSELKQVRDVGVNGPGPQLDSKRHHRLLGDALRLLAQGGDWAQYEDADSGQELLSETVFTVAKLTVHAKGELWLSPLAWCCLPSTSKEIVALQAQQQLRDCLTGRFAAGAENLAGPELLHHGVCEYRSLLADKIADAMCAGAAREDPLRPLLGVKRHQELQRRTGGLLGQHEPCELMRQQDFQEVLEQWFRDVDERGFTREHLALAMRDRVQQRRLQKARYCKHK